MIDIKGHEKVFGILKKSVTDEQTAQSYLFSGIAGIGKLQAAIEFACMLNCRGYLQPEHFDCKICDRIRKGNCPDVRVEKPHKGSFRIDRVRYLQSFLKYSPVEAAFRVTIIDDAHLINRSAQNALLKTLEEPPSHSILILVTPKASNLLSTVRSRLRRVKFAPISKSVIGDELMRTKNISAEEAQTLAGLSSGSLGRALEIYSANTANLRKSILDFLNQGPSFGLAALLELSAQASADQETLFNAIEFGMTWVRDSITLKLGAHSSTLINADIIDFLKSSAQHHSVEKLLKISDLLANGLEFVGSESNINRNILADVMFLKIYQELIEEMA